MASARKLMANYKQIDRLANWITEGSLLDCLSERIDTDRARFSRVFLLSSSSMSSFG